MRAPQAVGTDRQPNMQRLPPEYLFNTLGQRSPGAPTVWVLRNGLISWPVEIVKRKKNIDASWYIQYILAFLGSRCLLYPYLCLVSANYLAPFLPRLYFHSLVLISIYLSTKLDFKIPSFPMDLLIDWLVDCWYVVFLVHVTASAICEYVTDSIDSTVYCLLLNVLQSSVVCACCLSVWSVCT